MRVKLIISLRLKVNRRGTAVSRKSVASVIGELIENPEKYVAENLNIAKPN